MVRIQDPKGGSEGYTFDLEWRGEGAGSTSQRFPGRDRGASPNSAVRTCQDAVRERATQQYGLRDIAFRNLDADAGPGRNDAIVGSFDVSRGNYRDTYRFSCAGNLDSGRVRRVEITQERDAVADRAAGRDDATSACARAAEEQLRRDGFRNARFGWLDSDNRQSNRIAGTATAQRGDSGRSYDFDVRCSVNLDNGDVRSVQVDHR